MRRPGAMNSRTNRPEDGPPTSQGRATTPMNGGHGPPYGVIRIRPSGQIRRRQHAAHRGRVLHATFAWWTISP